MSIAIGVDHGRPGGDMSAVATVEMMRHGLQLIDVKVLRRFSELTLPTWFMRSLQLHRATGAHARRTSARGRKRARHEAGMRSSVKIKFRRYVPRVANVSLSGTLPRNDGADALAYMLKGLGR